MPRQSKAAKAASRTRIVAAAARRVRQDGIAATGVADVMREAGLTHGGFYRHFGSKEELVAAAIAHAVDEILGRLKRETTARGAGPAVAAYIDRYLSEGHVEARGEGCALAALAGEAGTGPGLYGHAIAAGTERAIALLAPGLDGPPNEAQERAAGLLSLLVGAIVLARTTPPGPLRTGLLAAARGTAESQFGVRKRDENLP